MSGPAPCSWGASHGECRDSLAKGLGVLAVYKRLMRRQLALIEQPEIAAESIADPLDNLDGRLDGSDSVTHGRKVPQTGPGRKRVAGQRTIEWKLPSSVRDQRMGPSRPFTG